MLLCRFGRAVISEVWAVGVAGARLVLMSRFVEDIRRAVARVTFLAVSDPMMCDALALGGLITRTAYSSRSTAAGILAGTRNTSNRILTALTVSSAESSEVPSCRWWQPGFGTRSWNLSSMAERHLVTIEVEGRPATFATAHEQP